MEEINIEDHLNSKFNNFEIEPLPGSFNAVMEKVAAAKDKKRRAGFFYLLSGVAALVLLYFALPVSENLADKAESNISIKESIAPANSVQKISDVKVVNSAAKNETSLFESKKSNAPKNLIAKNKAPSESSSIKENNQPIPDKNLRETEQLFVAEDPKQTQKDQQQTITQEPESNSIAPMIESPGEAASEYAISKVNPDVLEGVVFSMQLNAKENLAASTFDAKAGKDLLRLQSLKFKPQFFAGISCQAIMMGQTYALNSSANVDPIKYPEDFKSSYIKNRRKESSRGTVTMPGILFGVGMPRFEIRATFGAFQMRDYEIINFPEDSLTTVNTNTLTQFGLPGTQSVRSAPPSSQLSQGEQCGNIFNYVYGSLGVNAILRFYNFRLKPGIAVGYNRSLTSTYVLVDDNGYQKHKNYTKHLNKNVYSLSLNCGVSKRLSRLVELQVSPVYIVSLSSVFDEKYFLSQRFNGFGIEGALIYKFPVKLGK